MSFQEPQGDSLFDRIDRDAERLRHALETGTVLDPDRVAADRREASRRGMPVSSYRTARERNLPIPPANWQELPDQFPEITAFLSRPENAAVAHDDIENLSGIERALTFTGDLGRRLAGSGGILGSSVAGLGRLGQRAADRVGYSRDSTTQRLLEGFIREGTRVELGARNIAGTLNPEERARFGDQAGLLPDARETGFVGDVTDALGQLTFQAATAVVSRGALSPLMLVGQGARSMDVRVQQDMERDGRTEYTAADDIALAGGGAATALLETLGLNAVLGRLPPAVRARVQGRIARVLTGGATEAVTEGADTAVQNLLAAGLLGEDVSPGEGAAEAAAVGGTAGAIAAGIIELLTPGRARNRARENQAAVESLQAVETLQDLQALSEASKLREREPATFQQFVEQVTENGPVENIYVDAQTFAQSLNDAGIDIEAVTEAIPALAEQLPGALATGGDLRMTAGEFAAHIAGTDATAGLLPHLRTDPFAMSQAQAKEFMSTRGEALQAEVEAAVTQATATEELRAGRERVQTRITEELNTTGRFTKDVNAAYASLPSAFYDVMGARLGLTAEQAAEKYPLKFAADLPASAGRQVMEQDADTVELVHFSNSAGLTASDPSRWGGTRATPDSERMRRNAGAPGRTYFGVRDVYEGEQGVGIGKRPFRYTTRVPASKLYDFDADPQGLKPTEGTPLEIATAYEQAIQAAGFSGYRSDAVVPGAVALFEPAEMSLDSTFAQEPLTPAQAAARAEKLADEIPGLKGLLPYLSSDEKAKLRRDTAAKIAKLVADFPDAEEMAAVAYAGRAKRGWYENSAQAILEIFGARDAPRFAALLAALSPQTSVESNAFNALATWTNWINAGRPTDKRAIIKIMGESVQGKGTEESVLNAWINNSVTALTAENPNEITLSGPKVNSFMMNLVGVVDEVTNDSWMANYALVEQSVFKKTGAVPGKGPGYIAMNAVARRAAEIVSEKTGQDWSAAEVQETVWSLAKTLYEKRDAAGERRTTKEILAAGDLTAEDIGSTPDFAVLFVDGVYRRILEAGGYGAEIDALDARGQPARRDGAGGDPLSVEGTGFDEGDFARFVDQAAARLEELRARRREGEPGESSQLSLFAQGPVAEQPLEGQPQVVNIPGRGRTVFGPFKAARDAARKYMADAGLAYAPPTTYAPVDPERAKRIADEFEAMKHDPSDPEVAAAYRAMIDETLAQWEAIKATGLKVEFITGADPYAATPRLAILDVVENNHLWVFPTSDGFGSSDADVSGNPLLEKTGEVIDGHELVANDVFRIVHDYFGHIKDGNGFRADGEENAWQSHAAMYSPLARRAMTTETRGQNSWVNFGPKAEFNRTASASETVYADQKIGLLPEWVSSEGFLGGATFDQTNPFYSALERAVENSQLTKAPAAQWKATLAKTPGVKKEELDVTGVNDWLDGLADPDPVAQAFALEAGQVDAKGNVSKETVLAFVRAGGVQLEETVLGETGDLQARIDARAEEILDEMEQDIIETGDFSGDVYISQVEPDEDGEGGGWVIEAEGQRIDSELYESEDAAQEQADEYNLDAERENLRDFRNARRRDAERQAEVELEDDPSAARFENFSMAASAVPGSYREFLLRMPFFKGEAFRSAEGHFDGYDDVLGFVQLSEHADAEGKRVLFLSAVQSTHHQAGRDEGYAGQATPEQIAEAEENYAYALRRQAEVRQPYEDAVADQIIARITELEAARDRFPSDDAFADNINVFKDALNYLRSGGDPARLLARRELALEHTNETAEAAQRLVTENLRVREAGIARDALYGGVADAPWKKSWDALLMKRMIRYAVDNGFEKVAWINGNQQNGGQTGGDGSFFYERNLVNTTNDILKKFGTRVGPVDMRPAGADERDRREVERLRGVNTPDAIAALEQRLAEKQARPATSLGIQNGFEITPELAEAASQGFALFQPNRGQIAFGQDVSQTPSVISMLRTADLSTFIHETGHFFLEATAHMANQPDAPADIAADFDTILRWFEPGMTRAQWNGMSLEQRRPYHEKWARGFEAYHFEGRSPSLALRDVFRRFSAWLKNVYKSLTALDVELTDEVRQVMDRMLATEAEINEMQQVRGLTPAFASKPEFASEAEWDEYQRLAGDATAEAIEQLEQRSARDMRWASGAKDRYLRSLQREGEEQRKAIRAEVTAEVMAEPVNRARNFLRRGLGENGEPVEGASKLDLETLKALYPADGTWTQLRRGGKYGEVATDGLHPDIVAGMFGYPNGEALIDDLVNGEDSADKIKGMTDQRMLERYGDLADPQSLERAANEAVANEARAKFIQAEMAMADKAVGKRSILNSAAKEFAASVVNRLELKRLRPAQYLAAQGRAAKAAEKALRKDDLPAFAEAKRNQLVNLHTGRAVQQAQKDVEKTMRLFTRIVSAKDDSISKSRNMDLVNAARAILSSYGIGRVKNDPTGYMKSLSQYDPTLYADIEPFVNGARGDAKPVVDLTYEQFQALRDTVNQLWVLSRRTKQIEIDGKLLDREAVTAELGQRLEELGIPDQAGIDRAPTDRDNRVRDLLGARAALRRVEMWARGLDPVGYQGPFTRFVWNPVSVAAEAYRAESGAYIKRFRALLDTMRDELKPGDIKAPELGYTFGGKSELYHALLHTGNGSNKSKLLLGRGWGKKHEDGSLDDSRWQTFVDRLHAEGVLTERDWTFVQAVWDLLEETKPGAQKAHHAIYGRYFDEVSADPVDTPFGQLRGGYVPAMTDGFLVQDAVLRAEQEAIEGGDSAMFPAASNGFTKSRVEDYTRELALDLRLLPMHLDKVLKFTHLGPPVRDVARLLKDRSFSKKLQAFDPTAQTDLLLPWLQRSAKQLVETPSKGRAGKTVDRFFGAIRSRVGMQLMFANAVNTVQQLTALPVALLRVRAPLMGEALWLYSRNPKGVSEAALSQSALLRGRADADIFEARQEITRLTKLNPNMLDDAKAWSSRHAYFAQTALQNVLDVVVWTAAFNQAVGDGQSDRDAGRFADNVIRETQHSMAPEDVSRFETGHPFVRMFTQFAGYFNMMANLNATEVQLVARSVGLKKGMGRLFYIYLMGFAIPAVIGEAIAKALRGGLEDEDGDGYMDDLLAFFFSSQARFALAAVPVVGQAANAVLGGFTSAPYDDRISMSPAVSVLESGLSVPAATYAAVVEGEEFNRSDVRNTLNLLGVITGLPVGALARPASYGVGVAQGDIEPTGPMDAARGYLTGAPSPESRQ